MPHGYVVKLGVTEACLASMASGMILAAFMQCTPNFSRHPIRCKLYRVSMCRDHVTLKLGVPLGSEIPGTAAADDNDSFEHVT